MKAELIEQGYEYYGPNDQIREVISIDPDSLDVEFRQVSAGTSDRTQNQVPVGECATVKFHSFQKWAIGEVEHVNQRRIA